MLVIKNNKLILNANKLVMGEAPKEHIEILTYESNPARLITGPCTLKFMIPSYWINGGASDGSISCQRLSFFFECDKTIDSPICTLPNENTYKLTGDGLLRGWDFPVVGSGGFFGIKPTLIELNIQFFGPGELIFNLPTDIDTAMNSWLTPELDHEYEITDQITPLFLLKHELNKNKSCYIKCTGGNAKLFYGLTKDFTPVTTSVYVKKYYDLQDGVPVLIFNDFDSTCKSFFKFAKLTTDSKCTLSFITVLPPKEGIVPLNLNESIYLSPDNNQVYCLPKISNSIKLINSITSNVTMYVSNVPEFEINDTNVISKYVFNDKLQLSTADISYLGTNSTDDYIYLRFQCNEYTTLTPESWESSNYASDSILITHDNLFTVNKNTLYRIHYNDWKNYDFSINWTGYSKLQTYFSFKGLFTLSSSSSAVIYYKNIKSSSTVTVDIETSDAFESKIIEEDIIYIKFKSTNAGIVKFTSNKYETT